MTPRLGIVLGGAALCGLAAASLAAGAAGPRTAVQLITPANAFGGDLLGSPGPAAGGVGAGWLLIPTLHPTPAPAAVAPPPVQTPVQAPPGPAPASAGLPVTAPIHGVLVSLPVHLPVALTPLPTRPTLPVPVALPPLPAPSGAHHPGGASPGGHPGGHPRNGQG